VNRRIRQYRRRSLDRRAAKFAYGGPAIPDAAANPSKARPTTRWEHRYLGQERFPETLSALEIEHFFTLDEDELASVRERRGPLNRLALALQIGFLKLTGRTLNSVELIPSQILDHLPDQESDMVLKIERFQPEGMNVRMSGGKPSYSHVVTVSGNGKIVYTAGQLARDIDGNCVGKGDMRAQMEQTIQNLDRCLKAAGATWADVVKTNTFVTDFDEFQKCADIRMRYLGVATPTSTTVGVTRLAGPDFMIEIEAVAVVNS
jgi:2-iminobutanoate/2-iminopropanoate deaminase